MQGHRYALSSRKKIGVQTINADREDTVACAIRNSERGRAQKIAS